MLLQQREFEQFLRRVRRRFLVLRLLERTGLGILIACAAALPLLLIALWRGQPALPLTLATLVVGALAGLLWGILTRPGELEAAMEADRQLDWADLLASALSVADRGDDPWARAVASIADVRCRQTLPATIVLRRLGARAWGGIGLATALVVALGLFPTYSTLAPARGNVELSTGGLLLNPHPDHPGDEASPHTARRNVVQREPEDSMRGNFDDPADTPPGPNAQNAGPRDIHPPSQSVAGSDSQGAGAGHSDVKTPAALPNARQASGSASEAGGTSSSGAGKSNSSATGRDGRGGTASDESTRDSVPPWQSSGWVRDVKRAHDAMNSGEVPDAYRDVIRGYFDRQ